MRSGTVSRNRNRGLRRTRASKTTVAKGGRVTQNPPVLEIESPRNPLEETVKSDDQAQVLQDSQDPEANICDVKRNDKDNMYVAIQQPQPRNKLPTVTYAIPHSSYYDERKVKLLNQFHPCTLKSLHRYNKYNEHPLCAAMRSLAEAHVISRCLSIFWSKFERVPVIVDVGGSVARHFALKRNYVHSCVPVFEAKDLMRSFELPGKNYCRCLWQQCLCMPHDISMSVHSLYYVSPIDIAVTLLRQQVPVHYAVMHRYREDSGSMMDGEMRYVAHGEEVEVFAKGCETPYVHSKMEWMNDTVFHFNHFGQPYTLCWEKERSFLDVFVYKFVVAPGTVSARKLTMPVVAEEKESKTEFLTRLARNRLKPELPIGQKSLVSFVRSVRMDALAAGVDVEEAARVASDVFMNQDVIISLPTQYTKRTARVRQRALSFDYGHNYLSLIWLAVQVLFPASTLLNNWVGVAVLLVSALFLPQVDLPFGSRAAGWKLFGVNALATCVAVVSNQLELVTQPACWLVAYTGWLLVLITLGLKGPFALPVVLYDYCAVGIPVGKLSKRKCIRYRRPLDWDDECQRKPQATPFVYHPLHAPRIPRNCMHNTELCIRNRVLNETPEVLDPVLVVPEFLRTIALRIRNELYSLDFEEWVSRFPPAKQAKFRQEFAEGVSDMLTDSEINESKMFIKREFYNKLKVPRPIHSSSVLLNFTTGRWLIMICELLHEFLRELGYILFPLHGDAVEIGQFFEYWQVDHKICQSDFTSFDSTQHNAALGAIIEFVRLCGAPQRVCQWMALDMKNITVRTRNGFKYQVRGIRASGRSETLLGNTLLTLMLFEKHLRYDAILVKGDDILAFVPNDMTVEELECTSISLRKQGFVAKLEMVDRVEAEFCSSYFVPFRSGYCLTPKPGKVLGKVLWCKDLSLNRSQREIQFVGIVKGMSNIFADFPGLKGLYSHPIYKARQRSVEGIQHEYNEYSHTLMEVGECTYEWLQARYALDECELSLLEEELQGPLPICLQSPAAEKMMQIDWNAPFVSDDLEENEPPGFMERHRLAISLASAVIEESVRYCAPVPVTIVIGLVETFLTRNPVHLLYHLVMMVMHLCGLPILAVFVHLYANWTSAESNTYSILTLMPRRNRRPNARKSKQANNQPKSKQPRRRKGPSGNPRLHAYAALVSDPCSAQLTPGIYGTEAGMLSKHKTSHIISTADQHGYVLWSPTYASGASSRGGITGINVILFSQASATVAPLNTVGSPLGSGGAAGSTAVFSAGSFLFGSTVAKDYRTISACLRMMYTGPADAVSGIIGYVENLSTATVLSPLSVSNLLSLCGKTERLGLTHQEVTARPSMELNGNFNEPYVSPIGWAAAESVSYESDKSAPWMGFVWSGVAATSQLRFEAYQNIEWRPSATIAQVLPTPISRGPSMMNQIVAFLDQHAPGWTTTIMRTAKAGANVLMNQMFSPNLRTPRITYPGFT